MKRKGLDEICMLLLCIFIMQLNVAKAQIDFEYDSVNCIQNLNANDCAVDFTKAQNLKNILNSIDDSCVLSFIDQLINNSTDSNCRKSLNRIVIVSDGYISDYLASALATKFLTNPKYFFSNLYTIKKDRETKVSALLIDGLAQLHVENLNVIKKMNSLKVKSREKNEIVYFRKQLLFYLKSNPDL